MPKPQIIWAVDPGGTTGVASACLGRSGRYSRVVLEQVEGGRFGFYDWTRQNIGQVFCANNAVVCENFIINTGTATKSRQADPLMIAGYLEGKCYEAGTPFLLQTPAQAKSFATDDKLKHLGWWNPSTGGHANDAARHLLVYLVTQVKDDAIIDKLGELL